MACMTSTTSSARERELFRYYQPSGDEPELFKGAAPKAAADPILTAFAQLGALRLNAKRGLINLQSDSAEYIIAESGQKLSLQKDDDENDRLWHGAGVLSSQNGMGRHILRRFSAPDAPSYLYVGDLSKEEQFKDKPKVTGPPYLRFIASVPLKTPAGIIIGAYIIVDDNPRVEEVFDQCNIEFMQDMAVTIMDHLEAGRSKRQHFRAESMIKAMGLFIEGKGSLREWWLDHGHKYQQSAMTKRKKTPDLLVKEADREFGVQDVNDYFSSRAVLNGLNENTPQTSGPPSPASSRSGERGDGRPTMPRGDTLLSDTVGSTTILSKSWQERNSSVTTFDTLTEQTPDPDKQQSVSFDLPPENPSPEIARDLQNAVLSSDMRSVFARSSNLIREAIGVDGVIYFDASVGAFAGSFKNPTEQKPPGAFAADAVPLSSEDEIAKRGEENEAEGDAPQCVAQAQEPVEKCCNILGFSTRRRSTLRGHAVAEEHEHMPEAVLRKLLKRYPHGKVFNFEDDGAFSSSESDHKPLLMPEDENLPMDKQSEVVARRNRVSREAEAKAILDVLPGARSVFWYPLWDQSRERWFAGSLVWSTCPSRVLCPVEDITYLAAFGNSTMAEIARVSAAVLSKMKSDFISSISHELRSPLHGVLASVEFLQETDMTEIQADMVNNIHASGKVLLDTINHVLDFSKVNRKHKDKKRMPKRKGSKKGTRRQSVDDAFDEKADICVLSEEVIETVYAGRAAKKAYDSRRRVSETQEPAVSIIVDINWRVNWTFEIDPGAWRRVLMNLFSNAMKFTKQGFIKLSMDVEEDVATQRKVARSNLILKVKDSGKGIGQEFLRHQIYKPFTQEDELSTGAGLGLSIVKAIIQDMGGRIDFTSEPGTGTEVTVKIPLTAAIPDEAETINVINEVREKTRGLKFRLDGFERYPDISEAPTGILSADAEAAMFLKSSVQSALMNWFEMEHMSVPDSPANVIVIMESGLGGKSLDEKLKQYPTSGEKTVVIVLTGSYHVQVKADPGSHFRILYLQQPNGPHKFAKVLQQAFCRPENTTSDVKVEAQALPTPPISSTASTEFLSPSTSATFDFAPFTPSTSATFDFAHSTPTIATPGLEVPSITPTKYAETTETHEVPPTEVLQTTDIHKENLAPPNTTSIAVPTEDSNDLRVLLVEDNEINLKLLVATMRKLKLYHVTATNGLEALNSYKDCHGNFDVVFMDISMPIMSGIESTQHIRRFEKERGLKPVALIALTGAANPSTRQEAFSVGVDLFLTKPVPMKALRGMLEDLRREGRGVFAG